MTIKMTMKEIKERHGIQGIEPTFLMCKECGRITVWYVIPTGITLNCMYCNSTEGFELVEVIDG